jgi:hypothetical protein
VAFDRHQGVERARLRGQPRGQSRVVVPEPGIDVESPEIAQKACSDEAT